MTTGAGGSERAGGERGGLSWEIRANAIDLVRDAAGLETSSDGAVLVFLGTVRNHNLGRPVEGVLYEAYPEMAAEELGRIVLEAAERTSAERIRVIHRTGRLALGEVSVFVGVATPHRAEGYEASRYVMEEIKKRLPVWKREQYLDGEEEWVPGKVPPAPGSSASEEAGT